MPRDDFATYSQITETDNFQPGPYVCFGYAVTADLDEHERQIDYLLRLHDADIFDTGLGFGRRDYEAEHNFSQEKLEQLETALWGLNLPDFAWIAQ